MVLFVSPLPSSIFFPFLPFFPFPLTPLLLPRAFLRAFFPQILYIFESEII